MLQKGIAVNPLNKKQISEQNLIPSLPNKIQTILYRQKNGGQQIVTVTKQKAFISQQKRFQSVPKQESPGPGSYNQIKIINTSKQYLKSIVKPYGTGYLAKIITSPKQKNIINTQQTKTSNELNIDDIYKKYNLLNNQPAIDQQLKQQKNKLNQLINNTLTLSQHYEKDHQQYHSKQHSPIQQKYIIQKQQKAKKSQNNQTYNFSSDEDINYEGLYSDACNDSFNNSIKQYKIKLATEAGQDQETKLGPAYYDLSNMHQSNKINKRIYHSNSRKRSISPNSTIILENNINNNNLKQLRDHKVNPGIQLPKMVKQQKLLVSFYQKVQNQLISNIQNQQEKKFINAKQKYDYSKLHKVFAAQFLKGQQQKIQDHCPSPGPGQYNIENSQISNQSDVNNKYSSCFNSKTNRMIHKNQILENMEIEQSITAPGPGSYNNSSNNLQKKNFHVNLNKLWAL